MVLFLYISHGNGQGVCKGLNASNFNRLPIGRSSVFADGLLCFVF